MTLSGLVHGDLQTLKRSVIRGNQCLEAATPAKGLPGGFFLLSLLRGETSMHVWAV